MTYANAFEDKQAISTERRRPLRQKTYLGGLAISRGGTRSVGCTVRNLSDGGAKVSVGSCQVIPEHTFLIINGKQIAYDSLVVWSRSNEFGLVFLAKHAFESLESLELLFLKPYVVERQPRASAD